MGPEHMSWGGWWIFPIIMIVFFFLMSCRSGFRPPWIRNSDKRDHKSQELESALDILKKRYAKGEISKDEFEEMKRDLN